MRVFYCGYGDIIVPLVAAMFHTYFLPRERVPALSEIRERLKDCEKTEAGIPYYIGSDYQGYQIYCINFNNSGNLGLQTVEGVIGSETLAAWSFRKCPKPIHWLIPVGSFLAKIKGNDFGKTFIGMGIRKEYIRIMKFVEQTHRNGL